MELMPLHLLHFLKANFLKEQEGQYLFCLKSMRMKMVYTIILLNPKTLYQNLIV